MRRRPQGGMVFFYRRRWPAVVGLGLGLVSFVLVWTLVGFFFGAVAGIVVGAFRARYFQGLGRNRQW